LIFARDLEMYAVLLKLRLPLITAAITVCIVLYLVHVHRDLVAHQVRLKTLEDRLATLGNMIGCCPVPTPQANSQTQTQQIHVAPTANVAQMHDIPNSNDDHEEDDETSSIVSDEIRDMNYMLDLIEEAQASAEAEEAEVELKETPTESHVDTVVDVEIKKDAEPKELEFKTSYTDEDFKTLEYNSLKTIAKHMGLTAKGTRDVLIQRIKEAQNVVIEA
jgi:hypothetical protein